MPSVSNIVSTVTISGTPTVTVSGDVSTVSGGDVVDQMDTAFLDTSSTNIPASASAPVTVVASLADDVNKIQVIDTTGGFIGIYSDPAGTPVLEAVYGPGSDQTVDVQLAATTVIGLRNMEDAAISSGGVMLNFIK